MKGIHELQSDVYSAVGGRNDVFALQDHTGNYYPQHSPFTLNTYRDDSNTVGAYLVGTDGLVKSGVIDIDINKDALGDDRAELDLLLRKQTLQIKSVLKAHRIKAITEDSGHKGYHLWIFMKEQVSAADMRFTLNTLANEFALVDERLHWELFPKQDRVVEGGLGNLIKLPFQLHKVTNRRCVFVDENFEPYFPQELALNDSSLIMRAPLQVGIQSGIDVGNTQTKVPPFNMDLMSLAMVG